LCAAAVLAAFGLAVPTASAQDPVPTPAPLVDLDGSPATNDDADTTSQPNVPNEPNEPVLGGGQSSP
jgi:hypothetical protein